MKKIGILSTFDGERVGINKHYYKFFRQFGYVSVLSYDEPVRDDLDLLVLCGGADVNPLRYGQTPLLTTDKPDPFKEYFDTIILPEYVKNKTPILVCVEDIKL